MKSAPGTTPDVKCDRPGARHRLEDPVTAVHPAAEAATAEVAAPEEPHRGALVVGGRRHELAPHRLTGPPRLPGVARGGREPGQHALAGEVTSTRDLEDPRDAVAGGGLEGHRHLALGAEPGPHDGGGGGDVADRDEERGSGAARGAQRQGDEDERRGEGPHRAARRASRLLKKRMTTALLFSTRFS